MADGSRHSMALVLESAYGVTPTTPAFTPIRHTQTSLGLSKDLLESEELRPDRMIADVRHGARQCSGDIGIELSYGSFDTILEALLCGTWATDVPAVGTDQLKAGIVRRSFTIERLFGDIQSADKPYHRFTGVEFNTLSLQINANAMVTGTIGVIGKDMVTATAAIAGATYATASATSPLDSFSGSLNEGGSPIAVITEIALELNNGLDPRFVVGSKTTIRPSIARSSVSGSITAYFENSAMIDKFINETDSSIDFVLPDGAGNELKFILPRVKYTGGQPDIGGEGPITLSMPFRGLFDAVTGTNLILERTP